MRPEENFKPLEKKISKLHPDYDLGQGNTGFNFNAVFDLVPIPMFVINDKLDVLRINKAGIEKYTIANNQLEGSCLGNILNCSGRSNKKEKCGSVNDCADCSLFQLLTESFRHRRVISSKEIALPTAENDKIKKPLFKASISPFEIKKSINMILLLENIADQRDPDSEMKLIRKKADEAERLKTDFLYNLSHEIRTPLTSIMGFSDLLLNSNKIQDISRFSEIIHKSGRQILNVVDDLATISSIITGKIAINKRKINVYDLYEETKLMLFEEHLASEKKEILQLSFNMPETVKDQYITIDPSIFKVVVNSLIRNAIKFTEKGFVEFGLNENSSSQITFYVKDSGIGIEKEKQEEIFELFRQGNEDKTRFYGGTGIGLSIAKSLMEISKGKIWLESIPGNGSTFYFAFPKSKNEDKVKKSDLLKEDPGEEVLRNRVILVVEDQENNFILLNELLRKEGASVLHAKSGEEAIYMIDSQKLPDLVLMDLKLPGMSGFKATQIIKSEHPGLIVIAQSAYAMPEDRSNAVKYGCDDFIAKPINNTELTKKILTYLHN